MNSESSSTVPDPGQQPRVHYLNAAYGWRSWLFTVDHKRIGILYLISISFFFFLGGKSLDLSEDEAPGHHTPDFYIDESGLGLGVRALTHLTLDYMASNGE